MPAARAGASPQAPTPAAAVAASPAFSAPRLLMFIDAPSARPVVRLSLARVAYPWVADG
jgi:hypothetical protein